MAQFNCEICGKEFEQLSRYERHKMTSHPERATSAADVETAIKGVEFPKTRNELIDFARGKADSAAVTVLQQLPDQEYRDSAEVARALGEIRSQQSKPQHQPSKRGGARAMESLSAARIARVFSGFDFPASAAELNNHAQSVADEEERSVIEKFQDKTYRDMSDVAKEIGRVMESSASNPR